jgi:alpha-mannosidase
MTNGEEGGQIAGKLTFKYAIAVLDASTSYADLTRLQDGMQVDIHAAYARVPDNYVPAQPVSYFELSNSDICVSVIKRPENGNEGELIVRCYNLSERSSSARFTSFKRITEVTAVNLLEESAGEVFHDSDGFDVVLGPWKIQTYRLTFG